MFVTHSLNKNSLPTKMLQTRFLLHKNAPDSNPPSTQQKKALSKETPQSQKYHNFLQRKNPNNEEIPKHNNKKQPTAPPPKKTTKKIKNPNQNLTSREWASIKFCVPFLGFFECFFFLFFFFLWFCLFGLVLFNSENNVFSFPGSSYPTKKSLLWFRKKNLSTN